jgi:uncharacterized protein (DUF302 family)
MMQDTQYAHVTTTAKPFAQAVERAKELLKEQGFGVLCEIDVTKTLKEKIGVDFRPYVILGACSPVFAHQTLSDEAQLGVLLPCNVVVQAQDGTTIVSAIDASKMIQFVGNDALLDVAKEIDSRLSNVIAAI